MIKINNPDDFQQAVLRTANTALSNTEQMLNSGLGLAGETGEYLELLKKHVFHGHDLDKDKCKKELGDVAFYLAWACQIHGFKLSEIMTAVIEKLIIRYPNGFNTNDSIARKDVKV